MICSLHGERDRIFCIDDYMAMYAPYIKRAEARELAQCYVVGLMMDGDRKSVEPMSEKVHASEKGDAEVVDRGKVGP